VEEEKDAAKEAFDGTALAELAHRLALPARAHLVLFSCAIGARLIYLLIIYLTDIYSSRGSTALQVATQKWDSTRRVECFERDATRHKKPE
jgi:hypothetical protein